MNARERIVATAVAALAAAGIASPAFASARMYDMDSLLSEPYPLPPPSSRPGSSFVTLSGPEPTAPPPQVSYAASPPSAPSRIRFSGAVGFEVHRQNYSEPSISVSEDGTLAGLTLEGQMAYRLLVLRGDLRFTFGTVDYSGTGNASGIEDFVLEGRIVFGRVFPLGTAGTDRIMPYIGYGYRRLSDDFGGKVTSTGAAGYDRISQYHYLPIGAEGRFALSSDWALKPTVEYDHLLAGTQESKLSQAVAGLADVRNSQGSGYGLRGALMAETLLAGYAIEFGPFVRYWNIRQSDTVPVFFAGVPIGGGFEPANHTWEAGLATKVNF